METSETADKLKQIVSVSEQIIDEIENKFNLIKTDILKQTESKEVFHETKTHWKNEFEKKLKEIQNNKVKTIVEKINNIETYEPFGIKNKSKGWEIKHEITMTIKSLTDSKSKLQIIEGQKKFKTKSKDWNIVIKNKDNTVIVSSNENNFIAQFYDVTQIKTLDFSQITTDNFSNIFAIRINNDQTLVNEVNCCSIDVYASNDADEKNKVFSIKNNSQNC